MLALLDCNLWLEAISASQGIPTDAALKRTEVGKILVAAQKGRNINGAPLRILLSRHVLLTCDHVAALRGWCEPGETSRWMVGIISRFITDGTAVFDNTAEDYPALAARAGAADGAEDAEDEAIMRAATAAGATLITSDWDLSGVAGRRGVTVHGPRELVRLLG